MCDLAACLWGVHTLTGITTNHVATLQVEELKAHPFLESVPWDTIRDNPAPIDPGVEHETDVKNFDEFPEITAFTEAEDGTVLSPL
jgi:hypothetical protein